MSEESLLAWIRKTVGNAIGDDCAVYRPRANEDLLFTTDQSIEGVHFRSDLTPGAAGERAIARALSDIAAMGGDPRFCLISLALPPERGERWAKAFFRGVLRITQRLKCPLTGGDLAHSGTVHIDFIVCGSVPRGKALLRSGAHIGDAVYVSGPLGKSWDRRHVVPRLEFGRALRGRATACIDISDGLSLDLRRLCEASGVAATIDTVPIARASTEARALHGGEDYELLFTLPSRTRAPHGSFRIGTIVRGISGSVTYQGRPLPPLGYDHFRSSRGSSHRKRGLE